MTASIWTTAGRFAAALSVVAVVAIGVGCADLADPIEDFYHPAGWTSPDGENFHGAVVLESANGPEACDSCHGDDYQGKAIAPACGECHATYPHTQGWMAPSSDDFHGVAVLASTLKAEACAGCHGENYEGGNSGVSCATCHPLYPHEMETAFGGGPRGAHRPYLRGVGEWDLSVCADCHGESYDGDGIDYDEDGRADKTCLTCHSEPEGPEACNVCHGDAATGVPPPDLFGSTDTSERGVGAHEVHAALGMGLDACATCHTVPATYDAAGHIGDDPGRAEIVFGGLAVHRGAQPSYDPVNSTCGGTYCHGGFTFMRADAPPDHLVGYADDSIEGNDATVIWTSVGTGEAQCGTCHGLPPTGHVDRGFPCNFCHNLFPDAHIDGKVNVYGEARKKGLPESAVTSRYPDLPGGG